METRRDFRIVFYLYRLFAYRDSDMDFIPSGVKNTIGIPIGGVTPSQDSDRASAPEIIPTGGETPTGIPAGCLPLLLSLLGQKPRSEYR